MKGDKSRLFLYSLESVLRLFQNTLISSHFNIGCLIRFCFIVDFSSDLNEVQLRAVQETEGAALVIAGAGSGKTRVLTYRIAQLLANGVKPYKILALTFTNKASREMKSRIDSLLGNNISSQLWMGTFHSIFSSILRIEADNLGYTSDFTIYDAQDSRNLIKSIIKEMKLDDKTYSPAGIASRISLAKNNLITAERYCAKREIIVEDTSAKRPLTGEIYKTYERRCKQNNVMDFDDLLLQMNILFRDFPEILEKYREKFSYVLVDEYQDTNYAQYLIIKRLSEVHQNICVVGDDAQSIYSFRGARIENILNFKNDYPAYKLYKLEQNYRSTTTIVNAANSVIHKNEGQIHKEVFSKNEEGEPIKVLRSMSDREEALAIAQEVKRVSLSLNQGYNSFAILYRTNAQSRVLEEAFRKGNIPYKIYGAKSFYQRAEIKDILAYLRLSVNNNDEESLRRIINVPKRAIGDTTVDKIVQIARQEELPLWSVVERIEMCTEAGLSIPTVKKVAAFRDMIRSFSEEALNKNAFDVVVQILNVSGMDKALGGDDSPEGISRRENKQEFVSSVKEFVENSYKNGEPDRLTNFIASIQLLTDQDEEVAEGQSFVTMMTVHSAKGLEFDNVIISGLEEDLFPSMASMCSPKQLEEERRLFYVAVTRAGKRLVLSYATNRFRNGQTVSMRPSRFIAEIPSQYRVGGGTSYAQPKYVGQRTTPGKMFVPERREPERVVRPQSSVSSVELSNLKQLNIDEIRVGMAVLHPVFGAGTVIEIDGFGSQKKAKISFAGNGVRLLLLKFAKLYAN